MKATELRIRNWVLIPYQNAPIAIPAHETQVQGITIFGEIITNCTPEHEGLKTHYNHVSGIPLTEEWLLKFEFEQPYDDSPTIFTKDIKESPFEEGFRIEERGEAGCYMIDDYYVKIKYVHQLQNLYFALTGEELTLKFKL